MGPSGKRNVFGARDCFRRENINTHNFLLSLSLSHSLNHHHKRPQSIKALDASLYPVPVPSPSWSGCDKSTPSQYGRRNRDSNGDTRPSIANEYLRALMHRLYLECHLQHRSEAPKHCTYFPTPSIPPPPHLSKTNQVSTRNRKIPMWNWKTANGKASVSWMLKDLWKGSFDFKDCSSWFLWFL